MIGIKQLLPLVAIGAALATCKPDVGQPAYLVTDYALLAVRAEPAEVKPGATVTYSFLLASPNGTVQDTEAMWNVCLIPKPPSESNAVSSACSGFPDAGAVTVASTFTTPVPSKVCQLFGPIAPPVMADKPPVRPRDPDSTGGYYLPVQVQVPGLATGMLSGFAFERIMCSLANAPSNVIAEYNKQYQANNDPVIDHADLVDASLGRLPLDFGPLSVAAGSSFTIEAAFAADSAEIFPIFDRASESLVDQQESLSMSWFVTGGTLEHDRTGIAAGKVATTTSNLWKSPTQPGEVYLWLVLRDSRGGTTYRSYQMLVVL
jgi:hypothetical protein